MNPRYAINIVRWTGVLSCALFLTCCSADSRTQLPTVPSAKTDITTLGSGTATMLEGYHDIADCQFIMGWVWNPDAPDDTLKVEIYDDKTLITTLVADEFRTDLMLEKKGNGKHSFTYLIPPALKDNNPHKITVKVAGTNYELMNTPKEFKCISPEPTPNKP